MSFLSLTFLAPVALLGLLALAIPIYLHMRHKPRAEVYKFPAIEFLLKAQKKRKRRFQVEQWLLMLFRILIISALAFLFAKPFIDQQFNDRSFKGNQPLVIVLDDSVSMMAGPANNRFFHEAVGQIRDLLRARGSESPTRLLSASNPGALARLTTAGELLRELSSIKPSTHGVTLDKAYRAALEAIERDGWPEATVQIFTDGSMSAWRELPSTKPEKVEVVYTSLREGQPNFRNVAITEVNQAPGDTNSIEVGLMNSAPEAVEIQLEITGTGLRTPAHRLRLEAYSRTAHRFGLNEPVPPTVKIRIPNDDFDLDNEVIYAPKSNRRINILIVDGDSHPEPIRCESFFVKNALGSDESEKYGYELDVVTPAGLTPEKAAGSDVICLLNVDVPEGALLEDMLKAGKGVFVSMGDRVSYTAWNAFFGKFDLETWEPKALPAPEPVDIKSFDHPFFHPLEEIEWQGYFQGVGIEKFRIMSTGRSRFDIPIARFDGSPLLLAGALNPGRLMIWTSTVDLDWTNFPLEFGFVPFIRQVVAFLSGRESTAANQNWTVMEAKDAGIEDSLNLKYVTDAFANLDITGLKPGIYTRQAQNRAQFAQVRLDPQELDFRSFDQLDSGGQQTGALEQLGFRSFLRSDLGPSMQWLLFILILVETLAAARLTLTWGAR